METELVDCYFCDEPYLNDWFMISSYNGIMICNGCEEFGIFNDKIIVKHDLADLLKRIEDGSDRGLPKAGETPE